MNGSRLWAVAVAVACLGGSLSASAPAGADDVYDYGEYLSSECTTCHRLDGTDAGIPKITGRPVGSFVRVMRAYRDGKKNHQIMQMIAKRLGDEELHALAVFYGKQGQ